MILHVDFASYWQLILFAAIVIAPLTVMFVSSIMRNDVTRLGIAHKDTSFWIESKRSSRSLAEISSKQADSKIVRRGNQSKHPRSALPQKGGSNSISSGQDKRSVP